MNMQGLTVVGGGRALSGSRFAVRVIVHGQIFGTDPDQALMGSSSPAD